MTMNKMWKFSWAILLFAAVSACKNAPAAEAGEAAQDQVAESTMTLEPMGGTPEEQAMPMKIGLALSQGSFAGQALRSNSKEEAAFNMGVNRDIPNAYQLNLSFKRQGKKVSIAMPFMVDEPKPGTYALGFSRDTLVMVPVLEFTQAAEGGQEVAVKASNGKGSITLDFFQPESNSVRGKANIIFPEVTETINGASTTYKNVNLQVVFNNQ